MPIDIGALIARPPINADNERRRGFDPGRAFDARSFKEFLAHAREVRSRDDGATIPYFHGYLQGMIFRMLQAGPERAATIARVLRDFAHRWGQVLAGEPPLMESRPDLLAAFVGYVALPAIAQRALLHMCRALARDVAAEHILWADASLLGGLMADLVDAALERGERTGETLSSVIASLLYGSPPLPRIPRTRPETTNPRDVIFIIYRDQLLDTEKALNRSYTKHLWVRPLSPLTLNTGEQTLVIQDVMVARRATASLDAVMALRDAYRHMDVALVASYMALSAHDDELGPFLATSAEVMMDELSHLVRAPSAVDRNIYWDGLTGRLLRELGAAFSVGLRPLRRYESIGPARQKLRNAENKLYQVLAARSREAVRTNRLDPLLTLAPVGGEDRPLLARGSCYFQRWLHEGDPEIGRCEVATVPWLPTRKQGAMFEILESRDLRHHVRAFVKWQAPGNPFPYTVIRHIRPEDFATVQGGQDTVGRYRTRAGESALTGILHPLHPQATHPATSTLVSAVAFLMARGIYYRRWSPAFALQPLGNRTPLIAGFAAWTRTRPPDYIVRMADAIDPTHSGDLARRIAEEYAERTAGRALPPLIPVVAPPPASVVLPVPPQAPRAPVAPSILPVAPPSPAPRPQPTAPWGGLELTQDLTRSSAFDDLRGPMQMHVAARGTLSGRRVYVELVDARIYEKVQAPLGAAAGAFVRVPQSAWKITRDEATARWAAVWADAMAKVTLDVGERRAELEKLKRLLVPQAASVFVKDFQFHARTIEPIDYVPMEGDLMLLVYADDEWEEVTGAGLLPPSSDERDTSPVARLLRMLGEALGVTMAHAQGTVLDYYAFVRQSDEFRIRGLDCFLAWPLYAAYVKRPLHGFYELQDEEAQADEEEPDVSYQQRPEALSDAIGEEAWQSAGAEYAASSAALAERIAALTGLPWPDAAASAQSLVFCAAYCLAKGLTTPETFAQHVRERVALFYSGALDYVRERVEAFYPRDHDTRLLDEAFLSRLRAVAAGDAGPEDASEILFSIAGAVQRDGGDRAAFDNAYQGDARAFVDNYDQHDALLQQLQDEIAVARVYEKACAALPGREALEEAKRAVTELQPAYDEAKAVADETARTPAQADVIQRMKAAKRVLSEQASAGAKVAALAGMPSLAALEARRSLLRAYVKDDARAFASDKATIALNVTREHNEDVIPAGVRVAEQLAFNAHALGALHQGASAAFFLETMCVVDRMRGLTKWPLSYWIGQLIDEDALAIFAQTIAGKANALRAFCSTDVVLGANVLRFLISSAATDVLEEQRASHPRKLIELLLSSGVLDNVRGGKLNAADVEAKALASPSFMSREINTALAELNAKFPTASAANNAKLTAPAVSGMLTAIARRFRAMVSPTQSERVAQLLDSEVRLLDVAAVQTQRLSDLLAFRISDVPLSALVTARGTTETIMARGTPDGEFNLVAIAVTDLLLAGADRATIQRDLMGDLVAASLGAAGAFATTVAARSGRQLDTMGYNIALRWDSALAEWARSLFKAGSTVLNGHPRRKKKDVQEGVEEEHDDDYRVLSTTKGVHDVVVKATLRPDALLRPTTIVPPAGAREEGSFPRARAASARRRSAAPSSVHAAGHRRRGGAAERVHGRRGPHSGALPSR